VLNELPVISADPELIGKLFYNMISNGLKFHKPNTRSEIKIYSKIMADPADPENELLEISFEDNGVGFEEKYADKLFHIFQKMRVHTTGAGIGLAVSRKICTLHGGDLTAKSKGENGAIFTATLSVK
jgi:two-component system, LuxR family, sensor kinase FixL